MLTNPSQLILKNSDLFSNQNVLVLNYEGDLLPKQLLESAASVTALSLDYTHHLIMSKHSTTNLTLHFGHQLPTSDEVFDSVIIYYPKAKALAAYLINLAGQHLCQDGDLIIVGENKGGVRSIVKQIPDYFDTPFKRDNARHCLLFISQLIKKAPIIKLADWISEYKLDTPQGEVTICNLVGVFSEKHLDEGTKLLLSHLPKLSGRVLDFGCGAGVIAAALLKAQPELKLECVDINAMALKSCELTLAANNFTAETYPSDGLSQTQGHFNGIISNPPFHDGLKSTTDIAKTFVRESVQKLAHGGYWHIVANRHLPYSDTISEFFGQVNVLVENNKYKVYSNK
ncbi:methyltransferase [Shewanella sp. D64]|uniref:methyltransferase n=1 Tax=unclassified Shewanella TaxID=196818 RepID=UPI0022BA219F|nr:MULTISPECIES: methyltransferase [unclassified Shewanella]MEC4728756.1 methyltransferase [Shewanella sp. D64]MEC4740218.1 methyltransferase [Shewanella sp. E94]WBJ96254.1 methyltransferase [Shewanella sp. MTB7]